MFLQFPSHRLLVAGIVQVDDIDAGQSEIQASSPPIRIHERDHPIQEKVVHDSDHGHHKQPAAGFQSSRLTQFELRLSCHSGSQDQASVGECRAKYGFLSCGEIPRKRSIGVQSAEYAE